MTPVDRLLAAAAALEVPLPGPTAERLVDLAQRLQRWNRRIRLVGPGALERIIDDHILDGIGFARILPRAGATAWYDIGSGAGLPGLVLATLFPSVRFECVEPVAKKSAFITHAATGLQLDNVVVHTTRVESLEPGGPRAAMSRATFAPPEWAVRGSRLVGPGGWVLVALGAADAPDLRRGATYIDDYTLPRSSARRSNLLLKV